MPLKDVNVVINIRKAARLIALGKPVILAKFDGPTTYTSYSEPDAVAEVFGRDSVAHKLATTILKQGDTSTETLAILTYNPTATTPAVAKTAAQALETYFGEDFYFVVADTQVPEEVRAIADVVERQGVKIFATTVTTMEALELLETYKYDRTFAMYHETPNEYPAEALIGGHGSKPTGSITYKFKKLVGITPQNFTTAKVADIEALYSFVYAEKFGTNETTEGTVLSGEYIDVIHSKDWIKINIERALQEVLSRNDKVAFDSTGTALIETAIENVLKAAAFNGMIAVGENGQYMYSISMPKRSETNPADRAARELKGGSFTFELAGAIHRIAINGEIVV